MIVESKQVLKYVTNSQYADRKNKDTKQRHKQDLKVIKSIKIEVKENNLN